MTGGGRKKGISTKSLFFFFFFFLSLFLLVTKLLSLVPVSSAAAPPSLSLPPRGDENEIIRRPREASPPSFLLLAQIRDPRKERREGQRWSGSVGRPVGSERRRSDGADSTTESLAQGSTNSTEEKEEDGGGREPHDGPVAFASLAAGVRDKASFSLRGYEEEERSHHHRGFSPSPSPPPSSSSFSILAGEKVLAAASAVRTGFDDAGRCWIRRTYRQELNYIVL